MQPISTPSNPLYPLQAYVWGLFGFMITPSSVSQTYDHLCYLLKQYTPGSDDQVLSDISAELEMHDLFEIRGRLGQSLLESWLKKPEIVMLLLSFYAQHSDASRVTAGDDGLRARFSRVVNRRFWGEPNINMLSVRGTTLIYDAVELLCRDSGEASPDVMDQLRQTVLNLLLYGASLEVPCRINSDTPAHVLARDSKESVLFSSIMLQLSDDHRASELKYRFLIAHNNGGHTPVSIMVMAKNDAMLNTLFRSLINDEDSLSRILLAQVSGETVADMLSRSPVYALMDKDYQGLILRYTSMEQSPSRTDLEATPRFTPQAKAAAATAALRREDEPAAQATPTDDPSTKAGCRA